MKLALYLPNFRNKVTVKELEDLTALGPPGTVAELNERAQRWVDERVHGRD